VVTKVIARTLSRPWGRVMGNGSMLNKWSLSLVAHIPTTTLALLWSTLYEWLRFPAPYEYRNS